MTRVLSFGSSSMLTTEAKTTPWPSPRPVQHLLSHPFVALGAPITLMGGHNTKEDVAPQKAMFQPIIHGNSFYRRPFSPSVLIYGLRWNQIGGTMGFSFFSSFLVPTSLAHRDATEEDTVVGRTLSSRALIPILSWRVYTFLMQTCLPHYR